MGRVACYLLWVGIALAMHFVTARAHDAEGGPPGFSDNCGSQNEPDACGNADLFDSASIGPSDSASSTPPSVSALPSSSPGFADATVTSPPPASLSGSASSFSSSLPNSEEGVAVEEASSIITSIGEGANVAECRREEKDASSTEGAQEVDESDVEGDDVSLQTDEVRVVQAKTSSRKTMKKQLNKKSKRVKGFKAFAIALGAIGGTAGVVGGSLKMLDVFYGQKSGMFAGAYHERKVDWATGRALPATALRASESNQRVVSVIRRWWDEKAPTSDVELFALLPPASAADAMGGGAPDGPGPQGVSDSSGVAGACPLAARSVRAVDPKRIGSAPERVPHGYLFKPKDASKASFGNFYVIYNHGSGQEVVPFDNDSCSNKTGKAPGVLAGAKALAEKLQVSVIVPIQQGYLGRKGGALPSEAASAATIDEAYQFALHATGGAPGAIAARGFSWGGLCLMEWVARYRRSFGGLILENCPESRNLSASKLLLPSSLSPLLSVPSNAFPTVDKFRAAEHMRETPPRTPLALVLQTADDAFGSPSAAQAMMEAFEETHAPTATSEVVILKGGHDAIDHAQWETPQPPKAQAEDELQQGHRVVQDKLADDNVVAPQAVARLLHTMRKNIKTFDFNNVLPLDGASAAAGSSEAAAKVPIRVRDRPWGSQAATWRVAGTIGLAGAALATVGGYWLLRRHLRQQGRWPKPVQAAPKRPGNPPTDAALDKNPSTAKPGKIAEEKDGLTPASQRGQGTTPPHGRTPALRVKRQRKP
eukprot:GHVT01064833.1.p1 GENE.GHVT01064833.1~~GHVT01064833.1.p1  ORF type:complete len:765 (+),score=175.03 GHVT01064833.1:425-2719(+)